MNHARSATPFGLVALLLGFWLLARPYHGIVHDSILYTAQALSQLQPEVFRHDLFFLHGSQDAFTLFSWFHARVLDVLGIEQAALLLTLAGKFAWFASACYLAAAVLDPRARWLGLAVLISYWPYYDAHYVFSYGESFITGRLFGEVCVMLGLGFRLHNRIIPAFLALGFAALLHPLIALSGLAIGLLWPNATTTRHLIALAGMAALPVLLALLDVPPFDRLFTRFDPEWLAIVSSRNSYVFLNQWDADAWGRVAFLAAVLLTARHCFSGHARQLASLLLAITTGMLAAAWLAGEFHNVLITQLQLWRVLWLTQLLSLLLLGGITHKLWSQGSVSRMFLALLWSAALFSGVLAGVVAVGGYLAYRLLHRHCPAWQPSFASKSVILFVLALAIAWHLAAMFAYTSLWASFHKTSGWRIPVSSLLPVVGLTAWFVLISRSTAHIIAMSGLVILAVGLATWDLRDAQGSGYWRDTTLDELATALRKQIPPDAVVFWPEGLGNTWFWLRRPHYASGLQTVGSLFSRDTAMEGARRQQRLFDAGLREGISNWTQQRATLHARPDELLLSADSARRLCDDPHLNFLVIPASAELTPMAWIPPRDSRPAWQVIDCQTLRSARS